MKTKGALIWEFNQPWSIEEIEIGDPVKDEVKIQMEASGMCHSDHHLVTGDIPMAGFPVLGGHEGAGIVEKVGEGVADLAPGDHVVFVFVPSCGHCGPCGTGRPALCEPGAASNGKGEMLAGGTRLSRNGQPVHHMTGVASYATHAVISRRSLVKIDRELPLNVAALMGCAVLTGAGAGGGGATGVSPATLMRAAAA